MKHEDTSYKYVKKGMKQILMYLGIFFIWPILWMLSVLYFDSFSDFFFYLFPVLFLFVARGIFLGIKVINHTHYFDRLYVKNGYDAYSWDVFLNRRKVYGIDGKGFYVDITNKACQTFNCHFCDRIVTPNKENGMIMGVAPKNRDDKNSPLVIWYVLDKDGKARYCEDHDMIKAGFSAGTI